MRCPMLILTCATLLAPPALGDPPAMGFDEPDIADRWITVNDGVMGGRSSGGPAFSDGVMVFSGTINTNGGGFSSVRTRGHDWDLDGSDGLTLRVKGDGRTYSVDVRTDIGFRGDRVAYRYTFQTTDDGSWTEVRAPFDEFRATWRGRDVSARTPALDVLRAVSVGIQQADGNDGPFRLEVDAIDTFGGDEDTTATDDALDNAWFGTWSGTSAATMRDGSVIEFFTSLAIAPIDEGRWTWTIVYGEGAQRQVRAYTLEDVPGEGRLVINEQNSIVLDQRLIGRALYGRFVVMSSDIASSYTLSEDGETMEMVLTTYSVPTDATETGGENGVPTVLTTVPIAVQRAVLTREE